MEIWNGYGKDLNSFNTYLNVFLDKLENIDYNFNSGLKYSLQNNAKRLRPLILIKNAAAFGVCEENAFKLSLALELLHTASLIHDDLPCIDNDSYRRGKLSCHKVYGEDNAVIIGDSLINLAYEILLDGGSDYEYITASAYLAKASGYRGMLGGQYLDINSQKTNLNEELLLQKIHNLKTAELFKAAFACGALLAKLSVENVNALEKIGQNLGLCFQIKDDLLDVLGASAEIGKTAGKDSLQNKLTYVKLFGIEPSKAKLTELISESIIMLNQFITKNNYKLEYLIELLDYINNI